MKPEERVSRCEFYFLISRGVQLILKSDLELLISAEFSGGKVNWNSLQNAIDAIGKIHYFYRLINSAISQRFLSENEIHQRWRIVAHALSSWRIFSKGPSLIGILTDARQLYRFSIWNHYLSKWSQTNRLPISPHLSPSLSTSLFFLLWKRTVQDKLPPIMANQRETNVLIAQTFIVCNLFFWPTGNAWSLICWQDDSGCSPAAWTLSKRLNW